MTVSVDHKMGWSEAHYQRKPTSNKVLESLQNYITTYGIQNVIKTHPGTVFEEAFKTFSEALYIQHIACSAADH